MQLVSSKVSLQMYVVFSTFAYNYLRPHLLSHESLLALRLNIKSIVIYVSRFRDISKVSFLTLEKKLLSQFPHLRKT
jgi:hypothetical protein